MSSGHWAGFKGDDEVYIISLLLPLTTLIFGAGCPGTSPDSRLHSCLRRASGRLPSLLHSTLQSGPTRSHGGDHAVPVVGRAAVTQPPAPSWCTPLISPHVRALTGQCSPSSHPMSGRLQVNAAHNKSNQDHKAGSLQAPRESGDPETVSTTHRTPRFTPSFLGAAFLSPFTS